MLIKNSGLLLVGVLFTVASLGMGCGDSSNPDPNDDPPVVDPDPTDPDPVDPDPVDPDPIEPPCEGEEFESTFAALQATVFDAKCSADACHGSATSGGLDLRADASYENLFEVAATSSSYHRIYPGDLLRSELWRRIAVGTNDSIQTGTGMPVGQPPLADNELELFRLWLLAGAPRDGTVLDTEELIEGCLPEPQPIEIERLDPPLPGEGVQVEMPLWILPAATENEICFAAWYDFTDQVPEEFLSEDGNFFFYDAQEIRQDYNSHHLLLQVPTASWAGTLVEPEALGEWACSATSERSGESCAPKDPTSCGSGFCISRIQETSGCNGYSVADISATPTVFSGTQQANSRTENYPGTFSRVAVRGLMYFNSHAFNLTASDATMHAWANFRFATQRDYPIRGYGDSVFGIPRLLSEGAAPYTTKVMCDETALPVGAHITALSSHTHKRGKHWWYETADGEHIYDSYTYNDPLNLRFEEPLVLEGTRAERTIKWCALYNNGVDAEGNPDPSTVTRASKIQYGIKAFGLNGSAGRCEPVQCVNEGRTDINCDDGRSNYAGDDAKCDSSPGAGDGFCDACRIMGGVTTENEMFGPNISYFIPDS